jgi:hypothetical protein
VFGNCGVTNQAAGARSAVMTCWIEGFGWVDARAREEKFKKHFE